MDSDHRKGECKIDKNKYSNGSGGGRRDKFIMAGRQAITMEAFCQTVMSVMQKAYPGSKVEIRDVRKNNGACHKCLGITGKGFTIATVIPLDSLYKDYLNGCRLPKIVLKIAAAYENHRTYNEFPLESVHDFGKVKSRVCYALINRERNYQLLQEIPYVRFLDLAIIFYIPVRITETGMERILVRKSMMDEWGVTNPYDLHKEAHKNTCQLFRGRIDTMDDAYNKLRQLMDIDDPELFREFEEINAMSDGSRTMYVATNSQALYGANVILYDNLLKSFAGLVNDDLILLPSSIHECLIVTASSAADINPLRGTDYLKEMVISINREMAADEVLSDNVYRYDRGRDQITVIS